MKYNNAKPDQILPNQILIKDVIYHMSDGRFVMAITLVSSGVMADQYNQEGPKLFFC